MPKQIYRGKGAWLKNYLLQQYGICDDSIHSQTDIVLDHSVEDDHLLTTGPEFEFDTLGQDNA